MKSCIDPIVGGILSGWRYDISGIAPDMRGDYEGHLVACEYCRARQLLHRRIDIGLIALASLAAVLFTIAFFIVRRFNLLPHHSLLLQLGCIVGLGISVLGAILVAISTPAPLVITDKALEQARKVHDRLPEHIRNRLPEELRLKLSASNNP